MLTVVEKIGRSYDLPHDVQNIISDILYLYYWKDKMRRINSQYRQTWRIGVCGYLKMEDGIRSGVANWRYLPSWYTSFTPELQAVLERFYHIYSWTGALEEPVVPIPRNY